MTALVLIKCLQQIKIQILLHSCTPIPEYPSYISTMVSAVIWAANVFSGQFWLKVWACEIMKLYSFSLPGALNLFFWHMFVNSHLVNNFNAHCVRREYGFWPLDLLKAFDSIHINAIMVIISEPNNLQWWRIFGFFFVLKIA